MVVPVMKLEASLAMNSAMPISSSASPARPSSAILAMDSWRSLVWARTMSVSMVPGAMQFTRMLSGASSAASERV